MFRSYFKIAMRNLIKNRIYGIINILGLATGMAVALLIAFWIVDEISFDRNFPNSDRIMRVVVNRHHSGEVSTGWDQPYLLGQTMREEYGSDFQDISMTSWSYGHFLKQNETKVSREGMFVEPQFLRMFSIKLTRGETNALKDPRAIVINESLAKVLFGNEDPIGKTVEIDNFSNTKVSGVFADFPGNSSFAPVSFLLTWDLYTSDYPWVKASSQNWGNSSFQTFAQLKPSGDQEKIGAKIRNLIQRHNMKADDKPELFLYPMTRWHLYEEFRNGVNSGGSIQFVWMFGIIGAFVLLLACINFMNLSTARSEKRAKEVGIRKTIGSLRKQLVIQFLGESFLLVLLAFVLTLLLVQLALPAFNELSGKTMHIPFSNLVFWLASFGFILITALLAGSYPAIFLSSFRPVQILKGSFKVGRSASIPRKILVIVQFTVSLTLIMGTLVVYRQILFAKSRPLGYERNGLITTYGYPISEFSNQHPRFDYLRGELKKTGAVLDVAKMSGPLTNLYSNQTDFDWPGKDPNMVASFGVVWVTQDFGRTVHWEVYQGRDFSNSFASDSASIILNEAAVDYMSLSDPVNKMIQYNGLPVRVIGVIKNLLMESPYTRVKPTVFLCSHQNAGVLLMKLNPRLSPSAALAKLEPVFKSFKPESLFETQFVDMEYNLKFQNEERIKTLAAFFAVLAVLISCLGLFGLASFVAEQRTKEIGVRKVLGASVFRIWRMLSKEFVYMVLIACFIAIPIAWYFLTNWLNQYEYRTTLSWWLFALAIAATLFVTLLTVSFQAIKAALANPVKSLRTE